MFNDGLTTFTSFTWGENAKKELNMKLGYGGNDQTNNIVDSGGLLIN